MKDLYWRNHLRPRETDPRRIHDSDGSPEDQAAAFAILLNPRKKGQYDRAHAMLSQIGYVRRHLGLEERSGWQRYHGDFLRPEKGMGDRLRCLGDRLGGAPTLAVALVGLIVLVLVAVLTVLLEQSAY